METLTMDLDRKCSHCGEEGTGPNGLCLACSISQDGMRRVSDKQDYWLCEPEIGERAGRLISEHHPEASNAAICYMFRKKHTSSNGKIKLGVCQKQNDKQKLLHGFDFIIELAHDIWKALDDRQREALLLHELCHVFKDGETEPDWKIMPHDVEEFQKVIEVYGLWKPDLKALAETISQHEQRAAPAEAA